MQLPLDGAPSVVEKVPAKQREQEVLMSPALKVPAGHSEHELATPVPVENRPAWHAKHAAEELAPNAVEYVPIPQSTQSVLLLTPEPVEYLPIWQKKHRKDMVEPTVEE